MSNVHTLSIAPAAAAASPAIGSPGGHQLGAAPAGKPPRNASKPKTKPLSTALSGLSLSAGSGSGSVSGSSAAAPDPTASSALAELQQQLDRAKAKNRKLKIRMTKTAKSAAMRAQEMVPQTFAQFLDRLVTEHISGPSLFENATAVVLRLVDICTDVDQVVLPARPATERKLQGQSTFTQGGLKQKQGTQTIKHNKLEGSAERVKDLFFSLGKLRVEFAEACADRASYEEALWNHEKRQEQIAEDKLDFKDFMKKAKEIGLAHILGKRSRDSDYDEDSRPAKRPRGSDGDSEEEEFNRMTSQIFVESKRASCGKEAATPRPQPIPVFKAGKDADGDAVMHAAGPADQPTTRERFGH